MKKILYSFFLALLLGVSTSYAQETTLEHDSTETDSLLAIEDIAFDFVHDLANTDIPLDSILNDYITVNDRSSEWNDYLLASLEELRINLMSKPVEQLEYIRYNEMPRKEIRDIDLEGKNPDDIIFIWYRKRKVAALYMEGNNIASFTLVSKGNNLAHFVTY